MNHRDIAVLMDGIAPILRGYVEKTFEPIGARILALEKRFDDLPAPRDGNDADPEVIRGMVDDAAAKAVAAIERPKDGEPGKDADPELIEALIKSAVDALPPAKDGEPGASVTVADLAPLVAEEVAKAVAGLPAPEAGKDADPEFVKSSVADAVSDILPELVEQGVAKAVALIPIPKDGEPGKNGADLADAIIGRDGQLILTLSNGSTKEVGIVVGKDGQPGKDGDPGKDGRDGFSLENFDTELLEDGKTVRLKFVQGDLTETHDIQFPIVLDCGVWREKPDGFVKGDGVTWGGSFFIAQRDTADKPETSDAWRLSVKRGRDGASAFDVARKAGFKGSEREWLDSLRPQPAKPVKAG